MDNYIAFGRKLEDIREGLSLNKLDVYKLTGISTETIRRIEYGKVIPKFETLDLLSKTYKKDVVKLFIDYRLQDYAYYNELQNKIELKFDNDEISSLYEEIKELEVFLNYIDNAFYKVAIEQLLHLVNSVVLYKHEKRYKKALNILIDAIKLTTPYFKLETYNTFVYNSLEIRLLMNMAFILNRLNKNNKYIEIIEFCTENLDFNDNMYPKLCHNLAGAYRRNKDYKKSLEYANLAIKTAQNQRNYNGFPILFYGKGLSEFHLGIDNYKETFKMCLSLCDAFGQLELKETLINTLKEGLGIDLRRVD